MGWRWLTHKQKNIPKYVTAVAFVSFIGFMSKFARPELHPLDGFTNSFESRLRVAGNEILDDKKIVTLAQWRWKMINDKKEAEEYFAKNGYKPRATNQHLILNDNLGY